MPVAQIMSSNLPLLFAKGQPRSLETIVQDELEEFVNFMVLCSLKIELAHRPDNFNQLPIPRWWPEDVAFRFPICENGSSDEKKAILKKLVCRCYTFYDCEFYLKFSSELSEKPSNFLKYQRNTQDNTTTILDADGQVLVKCRNINFSYDKRQTRYTNKLQTEPPSQRLETSHTQPKRIAPLIDLTFESSGDESEVRVAEQTVVTNLRKSQAPAERNYQIALRRRRLPPEEAASTSNAAAAPSRTTRRKLLIQSPTKKDKQNGVSKETTSRPTRNDASTSSRITRRKLLLENHAKQDDKPNETSNNTRQEEPKKKRKRSVQLPITRKKRIFEDFPREEKEPEVLNKDQYMARLSLTPHIKETVKLGHKIEGRKKLAKSFSWVMLTSERGQAILARNDKRFNMAASLDRNNKSSGTHHQEEQNHMCTRSNNNIVTFSKDAFIPDNPTAYAKGHIHMYTWPRRGRKMAYQQKGPSVKQCSVELTLLSDEMIHLWSMKKCSKTTMTPEEWSDDVSICDCRKIPLITLDVDSSSRVKSESTSTRCICMMPKIQTKSKANYCQNNEANVQTISSSEAETVTQPKHDSFKMISPNAVCASPQQINLPFLADKEGFSGFTFLAEPSSGSPSYTKQVFHRRPLSVVPPEPSTINEEIIDASSQYVTCLPDDNPASSTIKLYNFFRSLTDAIKWYTRDEPSDRLRDSLAKEGLLYGSDRSQENIKPFTELMLPSYKRHMDYFKIGINLVERDYCFERSGGASKLVTRRGERHYITREPCPACYQGKDNFCIYEFIRQAKLAGVTLLKNPKQLKQLFFKFVNSLQMKE